MAIRAIVFDLGGVILNIDYQATAKAFKQLGGKDFKDLYSQAKQSMIFDQLETGKIEEDAFRNELRKLLALELSDQQIDAAWNAMLLDLPVERMEFLEEISNRLPIYLLSNTNAIHVKAFEQRIEEQVGLKRFKNVFQKIYYSHEIGFRKPDREMFEWVIGESALKAQEFLFVDDSIQHVQGGEKVGIKAKHLKRGMALRSSVLRWLCL